jgi:hypothetical protein
MRRDNPDSHMPNPGDYGRDAFGNWYGMTPDGVLFTFPAHEVNEHPDGTITVIPSIVLTTSPDVRTGVARELWHGHLTKGVWIACGQPWKGQP